MNHILIDGNIYSWMGVCTYEGVTMWLSGKESANAGDLV